MMYTQPRRWAQWFLATLPATACSFEPTPDDAASYRLAQPHCPIDDELATGGTSCTATGSDTSSSSEGSSSDAGDGTTTWSDAGDGSESTGPSGGTGSSDEGTAGSGAESGEAGSTGASEAGTGGSEAGGTDEGGSGSGSDGDGGSDGAGDSGGTGGTGGDGGSEAGESGEAGGSEDAGTGDGGSGSSDGGSDDSGQESSDDDGGVDDGGADDAGDDDTGGGGGGPALKDFRIDVMSKSFIGPIAWGGLGAFPGPFWDVIGMGQFRVLAQLTDLSYSESPATGFQNTGDYRMWSDLYVKGKCEVGTGRIRVEGLVYPIGNPANVGWEPDIYQAGGQELGPVYGTMNPHTWAADTDDDGTGFTKITYWYVVSGHPNPALESTFVAAAGRASPDIWHKLQVELWCDDDGDLQIRWKSWRSGFPSLRTWIYSNGNTQLNVVKTAVQGPFSALWSLAPIPQP